MASVVWDSHRILYSDYLEKGEKVNNYHYVGQLVHLKEELEKTVLLEEEKKLFHQENSRVQRSMKPW